MKITVIGSHLCPDTLYALNRLSEAGAEIDFKNLSASLSDLKAYLDSFVADCVVNGLDDAKWEKHLKDVEGYRASEWVQWYQDYIDKKF